MSLENGFELESVLLRGAPIKSYRGSTPHEDPIQSTHRQWLGSQPDLRSIIANYQLFGETTNRAMASPQAVEEINSRLNIMFITNGIISGGLEIGLMQLVRAWQVRGNQRRELIDAVQDVVRSQTNFVQAIKSNRNDDDTKPARVDGWDKVATAGGWENARYTEAIYTAGHLASAQVFADIAGYKAAPPRRHMKNSSSLSAQLAEEVSQVLEEDSQDKEVLARRDSAVLEMEALIILWRAVREGLLPNSWSLSASQRLDLGFFRGGADKEINTDLICMFPQEGIAVPVQVKTHEQPFPGEGYLLAGIHGKDLYPRNNRRIRQGSIIKGVLGESDGVSDDYIGQRAQFIASKIIRFIDERAAA